MKILLLFFPLPRDKSWENWICKNELIFDFRGQNETEYNRVFILLLKRITFKKTPDHKGEKHVKTNLEEEILIIFSRPDELYSAAKERWKHDKNKPIIWR